MIFSWLMISHSIHQEDETVETDSSESTPSSDMVHLQSDQSDGCSPTRMASRSDVLTAHDVFSFELLSIHDDQEADKEVAGVNSPAATTTPNNTPIGMERTYLDCGLY